MTAYVRFVTIYKVGCYTRVSHNDEYVRLALFAFWVQFFKKEIKNHCNKAFDDDKLSLL